MVAVAVVSEVSAISVVQLVPSVVDWTVYPVMAAPPLLVGAVHVRVACASPVTTLSSVGAEGVAAVNTLHTRAVKLSPATASTALSELGTMSRPLVSSELKSVRTPSPSKDVSRLPSLSKRTSSTSRE